MKADASLTHNGLDPSQSHVVDDDHPPTWRERGWLWITGVILAIYVIGTLVVGIYWSRTPDTLDVREQAVEMVGNDATKLVTGSATTAAAIIITEGLLNKSGGYLSNDMTPPGVYLDNIPQWEFGALTELRDLTLALRNDFSRAQSQSAEDPDLAIAQPQFNYDANSWILPSTESEYRLGHRALERYFDRLTKKAPDGAHFFARADNLSIYLEVVEKRLGSLAQRLSYAVGQDQLDTDLAGDPSAEQATPGVAGGMTKTPWLEIDDVFFEARGYTWALLHALEAIEIDFAQVLKVRNALVSLQQINRELVNTQNTIWSPMILNGTGFGPMANHSLVMASYISRANAAIAQLRLLLKAG